MSFYRVKQFYWCYKDRITKEDISFINGYLNDKEMEIFNKLQQFEKKHCIKVAGGIYNNFIGNEADRKLLVKAALLHDVGKIKVKVNPIERSLLVITNHFTKEKIKKYSNLKKVNSYYNHADDSYEILKNIEYDTNLLYLVKNHHNNSIINDNKLNILKKFDNLN